MREEQRLVHEFVAERPTMFDNNRDPKRMAELLRQEMDELLVEIDKEDVNGIAGELPDVVWFCLTIAEIYGIDLENAFWAKGIRNQEKYPASMFDNGMTYEQAHTLCRALWGGNDEDYFDLPTVLDNGGV